MLLEEIMNHKVEEVRARFFYPSIPKPTLTKSTPNGSVDISSMQISINPGFIEMLGKEGIPEPDSFDEILSHEYTHITRFPGNAGKRMHHYLEARSMLESKDLAETAVYAFNEAQTNIFVGVDMKNEITPRVEKILARGSQGLNKILDGLYQDLFHENLGINLNKKERKIVKKLKEIRFTDQSAESQSLRSFIESARDYLKHYKQKTSSGFLGMFTQWQIQDGLSMLAQECADKGYNPNQFEQLSSELLQEGMVAPGTGNGILRESQDIYTALARNYAIPIVRRNIHGNGSIRPEEHKPFSIGTPLSDLDLYSSKGILPGVSTAWIMKEGESVVQKGIPDSIIVIDNSPSMPDPNSGVSIPVLGAYVIARAYLLNGRNVAVYSFGASDYVYGPSTDENEINKVLRLHSGNIGGTTFSPSRLEDLLKKRANSFDLSIISDMEISNLGDFISSISTVPKLHRIHLFYTNPDYMKDVRSIQESTKSMDNIGYAQLFSRRDIEGITLGELKKSIK